MDVLVSGENSCEQKICSSTDSRTHGAQLLLGGGHRRGEQGAVSTGGGVGIRDFVNGTSLHCYRARRACVPRGWCLQSKASHANPGKLVLVAHRVYEWCMREGRAGIVALRFHCKYMLRVVQIVSLYNRNRL